MYSKACDFPFWRIYYLSPEFVLYLIAASGAYNLEFSCKCNYYLQALDKQSEELAEGAGDFASIAEELAKRAENKKWFKL